MEIERQNMVYWMIVNVVLLFMHFCCKSYMYFLSIILWPYKNKEINFRRPDMLLHIVSKLPFLICFVWSASSNSPPRCVKNLISIFFFVCLDNFHCCSLRYTHTQHTPQIPKRHDFQLISCHTHTPF